MGGPGLRGLEVGVEAKEAAGERGRRAWRPPLTPVWLRLGRRGTEPQNREAALRPQEQRIPRPWPGHFLEEPLCSEGLRGSVGASGAAWS